MTSLNKRLLLATTSSILSLLVLFILPLQNGVDCFTLVMMGSKRRGKNDLKRILNDETSSARSSSSSVSSSNTRNQIKSLNNGLGQEITGVTLPTPGKLKGWEFGDNFKMVCANVDIPGQRQQQQQQQQQKYYAIQGNCPRCGFDLWKGDLIINDVAWEKEGLPRIACPTCSTTYNLRTGVYGPPMKRTGLQEIVANLARQSSSTTGTSTDTNAKAFVLSIDTDTGKIYCKER